MPSFQKCGQQPDAGCMVMQGTAPDHNPSHTLWDICTHTEAQRKGTKKMLIPKHVNEWTIAMLAEKPAQK